MKKSLIALLLLLSLVACRDTAGLTRDDGTISNIHHQPVNLPDGRQLDCVVYLSGYAGGLSCDWDALREKVES